MVERLKEAIEKARQRRGGTEVAGVGLPAAPQAVSVEHAAWATLTPFEPRPRHLTRNRIITAAKEHPAYATFDVLRTRLVRACRDNGWRRLGVTSPTKGCGKSMVSLNLAFSFARNSQLHTAVIDLDLRNPSLHRMLGMAGGNGLAELLLDDGPVEACFHGIGDNLAVCAGGRSIANSAEVLQSAKTIKRIAEAEAALRPDLLICDLPPMLAGDDVLGLLGQIDALLLVAAAGSTLADEITDCERLIATSASTSLLGVVLNRVEAYDLESYVGNYDKSSVSD